MRDIWETNWLLSLLGGTISFVMSYQVFVSYTTSQLHLAYRIRALFKEFTNVGVFIAEHDISAGEELPDSIIQAIRKSDSLVVIWDDSSKKSDWVVPEISAAKAHDKYIIPLILDKKTKLPRFWGELKCLEATGDSCDDALQELKKIILEKAQQKGQSEFFGFAALIGLACLILARKEAS